MLPPPPAKITFSGIAFKRVYIITFVALIAIMMAGFLAAAYYNSLKPPSYSGHATSINLEFSVSKNAEQQVMLSISHTYPIKIVDSSYDVGGHTVVQYSFYITDGIDRINYTVTVKSENGDTILSEYTYITAPVNILRKDFGDTYTQSDDYGMDLKPGQYIMSLQAEHSLDYSINEKSKYESAYSASIYLGSIGLISIVILALFVVWKWNAAKRAYATGQSPNTFASLRNAFDPHPDIYYGQPSAGYGSNTTDTSGGEYELDYICAKCGNIIQNPVVQNVITCEKCGEKEYIG